MENGSIICVSIVYIMLSLIEHPLMTTSAYGRIGLHRTTQANYRAAAPLARDCCVAIAVASGQIMQAELDGLCRGSPRQLHPQSEASHSCLRSNFVFILPCIPLCCSSGTLTASHHNQSIHSRSGWSWDICRAVLDVP